MDFEERLFVAGSFIEGSGERLTVVNPATKKDLASVHVAGPKEVDLAVQAAEKAWPAWADGDPSVRTKVLTRLAELVEENAKPLALAQTLEMGRPFAQSLGQDIPSVAHTFRYFAGIADKVHGKTSLNVPGFLGLEIRQPYGVTAGIIPWNGPLIMLAWKCAPALATGNASIIKSSEKSPLSALIFARLIKQAGVPDGILSILSGARETGELLSSHLKISKIAFTGSPAAGKAIAEASIRSNLKSYTLELGGKCPAIVFEDANLQEALFWVQLGFTFNSGQTCVAASRIYVQDTIFDSFAQLLTDATSKYPVGDPQLETTGSGPQADVLQHQRVMSYLEIAKKEGHALLEGGAGDDQGYYIKPAIYTDVKDDAVINKQEIFGPVTILHRFSTEEDVIRRANDTEFGLAAYVFTRDLSRAIKFSKLLQAGTVGVNTSIMVHPDLGFGGWKGSGIGRELGEHAIQAYTQTKSIFIRN